MTAFNESRERQESAGALDDGWLSIAEVQPRAVEWLWKPYIPLGKLTLFDGDPGVGKSWATCALVTAITRGYGLPGVPITDPHNVIMLSAEDGLDDTIRPRLDSMGAELSRVIARNKAMIFDENGIQQLEAQVSKMNPTLIIIDPLFAFVGGKKDIYRDNEARSVTTPLAEIAQAHGCAIIAVRHLTKQLQKAIYAGGGSMAFIGAARSALLFGHDANNRQKCGFVHAKCNLAPKGDAIGYRIESTADERGRFEWTGRSDLTAEKILAMPNAGGSGELTAFSEAKDFLREMLRSGRAATGEIYGEAKSAGIAEATLRRAKTALKVRARRASKGNDGNGSWFWELPTQTA
jgi:polyhydroxyalkanoate synthesis regulator phasin